MQSCIEEIDPGNATLTFENALKPEDFYHKWWLAECFMIHSQRNWLCWFYYTVKPKPKNMVLKFVVLVADIVIAVAM